MARIKQLYIKASMGCVHSTRRTREATDAYEAARARYEDAPSAFKEACLAAYIDAYIPKAFVTRMWEEAEWQDTSGYVWGFAQVLPLADSKGPFIRLATKTYATGWSAYKLVRAPDWKIVHIQVNNGAADFLDRNDPKYVAWLQFLSTLNA